LIEIGYDLQRQLRAKEAMASKEKAVLMQKIELLEAEIKEGKEREVNMKKMYDTMIRALKPSSNNVPKEIDLINEMHSKQLADAKQRQLELTANFEKKINDLRTSLFQCENERRNEIQQKEEIERVYKAKLEEVERRCKELEQRAIDLSYARKDQEEFATINTETKLNELNNLLDKTKTEHSKEIAKLKENYNNSLNEIKEIYEQEKVNVEAKLEKANAVIRSLQKNKEEVHESYLDNNENRLEEVEDNEKLGYELYSIQGDRFNLPSKSKELSIECVNDGNYKHKE
jgi:hypothetical protein